MATGPSSQHSINLAPSEENLMTMQSSTAPAVEINRVSVKLTSFWTSKPAAWFGRAEAQFRSAGIVRSITKFDAVVSLLAEDQCDSVLDLITNTPP